MTTPNNQRAPRFVKNPSGYHSHGKTHKEKVFNFGVHIKQFGWTGSWEQEEDVLKAVMKRGEGEVITIWWPDNQWWPDVMYSYAHQTQKCRNISHAAKLASEKPDPNKMRKATKRRNPYRRSGILRAPSVDGERRTGGREGEGTPGDAESLSDEMSAYADELIAELGTTLPFDKESTPEEIKAVIKTRRNPTLIWINRISGEVHQDIIKTWSRHLKVTQNKEGKTIIHFVGANRFHAVYVDSVIGVS
jgi:hypothetical protein